MRYLVKNNGIENVHAITLPDNKPSVKLLQKLGFNYEKTIVQDNQDLLLFSASITGK